MQHPVPKSVINVQQINNGCTGQPRYIPHRMNKKINYKSSPHGEKSLWNCNFSSMIYVIPITNKGKKRKTIIYMITRYKQLLEFIVYIVYMLVQHERDKRQIGRAISQSHIPAKAALNYQLQDNFTEKPYISKQNQ